jgi:general secretion pathway protein K
MRTPRQVRTRIPQHGVAIVLAMGVVALAALTASALLVSQSTWSRQIELSSDHVQAQILRQAGLDWARAVLSDDRRSSTVDHAGEPWSLRLPPIPLENGSLAGHIEDQQGKFNLNNLLNEGTVNPVQLAHFRRLLTILALPPALADSLVDWIDTDGEVQSPDGAEDAYYLMRQPPHLSANRPLLDVAELALVRGFDDNVLARLNPFVSALPQFTAVISAVVDGLNLEGARAIVAQRERSHFRDRTDFLAQIPRGLIVAPEDISLSSNYFVARMRVTRGGAQVTASALLARADAGWPSIVWSHTP